LAYGVLALAFYQSQREEESADAFEKALHAYERATPSDSRLRDLAQLASLRHNYALTLLDIDRDKSTSQFDASLALKEQLVQEYPDETHLKAGLARAYLNASQYYDDAVTMQCLGKCFSLLTDLVQNNPEIREHDWMLGQCAHDIGDAIRGKSLQQATNMYQVSLAAFDRASQHDEGMPYLLIPLWLNCRTKLGECFLCLDEFEDAVELLESVLWIAEKTAEQGSPMASDLWKRDRVMLSLGRGYALSGQLDRAVAIADALAESHDAQGSYDAARILALCETDSEKETALRDRAVQLLQHCSANGYFCTALRVDALNQEPDFSRLSELQEFKNLINENQPRDGQEP
jgi:tetratricopeptide (TPR) repeat protein